MRMRVVSQKFVPLLAALALVTAAGCDDDETTPSDDPCDPSYQRIYEGDGTGVVGPAGGSVVVSDPESPIAGVGMRVEPGSWDSCWEVMVDYAGIFSTEDYPDGFVPFARPMPAGSVEIYLARFGLDTFYEPPDSMDMTLSFPLSRLSRGETEMYAAYYYDTSISSWRVVLPDAEDGQELAVNTSLYQYQWSWGRVDLAEIDYAKYMEPALAEHMGAAGWEQMQATADSIYAAITDGRWRLDCAALAFGRSMLVSFRDYSSNQLGILQTAMGCGTCDIRTREFFDGVRQYIWLNLEAMMLDLFVDAIPGRLWFLKLAGYAYVMALEAMARSLPCDYECYVSRVTPPLIMNLAAYYASYLAIEAIDMFKGLGYIHCP